MLYTADTGFFIRLSEGHEKALAIWDSIKHGKGRLLIPSIVLVETARRLLKKGKSDALDKLYTAIRLSEKFSVCDLTFELARNAGFFSFTYDISSTDGCVIATAIATGYTTVITSDTLLRTAKKDGKIELVELL